MEVYHMISMHMMSINKINYIINIAVGRLISFFRCLRYTSFFLSFLRATIRRGLNHNWMSQNVIQIQYICLGDDKLAKKFIIHQTNTCILFSYTEFEIWACFRPWNINITNLKHGNKNKNWDVSLHIELGIRNYQS